MGSSKSKIEVILYYMGIHMGIARAIDELCAIEVGGKTAWNGSVRGNTGFEINQRDLFGGDKKEGGIHGSLQVLFGAKDQQKHQPLADMLGEPVPAYRGIASLFYNGEICANSPYPKAWRFRVRCTEGGWDDGAVWYYEKVSIWMEGGQIRAMNPAHILYKLWTGRDFRNVPKSRLDDAAWRRFADVLYAEGFGLCFKLSSQSSLAEFMQQVIDHVGASQYVDRHTGLIVPVAIRGGYNADDIPLFNPDSGLLGVDEYSADALPTGINEVIVNFKDLLQRGEKRQVREKNLGAIHALDGTVNSTTTDYVGIPTATLARRVARRDLNALAGFVRKFKIRLDRRAARVALLGGLIRISDPARGIEVMVLRIGKVDSGTFRAGVVTVEAATDVFGLPDTVYNTDEPNGFVPPDPTPKPIEVARLMEVAYRDLAYTLDKPNLDLLEEDSGFVAAVAQRPTALTLRYYLNDRITGSVGAGAAFVPQENGVFCGNAQLVADLDYLDTLAVLTNLHDVSVVQIGAAVLLGDEIVRVDAFDVTTNIVTLGRGCVDTVPARHSAGALLWFYQDYAVSDLTEYSTGVGLDVKLQPETSQGLLSLGAVTQEQIVMAGRAARPYPPGQFKINALNYPEKIDHEDITVSWAHRNRITQAEQLIDTMQGNITPEAATTYTLRLLRADTLQLLSELTGIDVDNAVISSTYAGNVILQLFAVRDGLESWTRYNHPLLYGDAPPPPTYIYWDGLFTGSALILSNNDKTVGPANATGTGASLAVAPATNPDMVYFEMLCTGSSYGSGARAGIGFATEAVRLDSYLGRDSNGYCVYNDGSVYHNASDLWSAQSFASGDVLMFALKYDSASNTIEVFFGKNGTWAHDPLGISPTFTMAAGTYRVAAGFDYAPQTAEFTMAEALTYAPPAGFAGGWVGVPQPRKLTLDSTAFTLDSTQVRLDQTQY